MTRPIPWLTGRWVIYCLLDDVKRGVLRITSAAFTVHGIQQPTSTSERPSAKRSVKCLYSIAGSPAPTLRHLGARAHHFHNLTELATEALQPDEALVVNAARRGLRARPQLPDTVAPGSNVAMFQVLPSTTFKPVGLRFGY